MAKNDDNEEEGKKKGGGLRLILMILGGPVLLAVGFAGGYVFMGQQQSPSSEVLKIIENADQEIADENSTTTTDEEGSTMKKIPNPAAEIYITSYHKFSEPLTTNLSGSRRFLQVQVGMSTQYDEVVIERVKTHEIALRSDILAVISSFSEESLRDKEGRDTLAAAIRDAINMRLEELEGFGGIEDVFFASFVLQ